MNEKEYVERIAEATQILNELVEKLRTDVEPKPHSLEWAKKQMQQGEFCRNETHATVYRCADGRYQIFDGVAQQWYSSTMNSHPESYEEDLWTICANPEKPEYGTREWARAEIEAGRPVEHDGHPLRSGKADCIWVCRDVETMRKWSDEPHFDTGWRPHLSPKQGTFAWAWLMHERTGETYKSMSTGYGIEGGRIVKYDLPTFGHVVNISECWSQQAIDATDWREVQ